LLAGLVRLHACKHTPAPMHPHTHTRMHRHSPPRPRTHTRYRPICNIYCFSTETMISSTRLSVALYAHYLSCLTLSSSRNQTRSILGQRFPLDRSSLLKRFYKSVTFHPCVVTVSVGSWQSVLVQPLAVFAIVQEA
jgi:hypothetical protein